MTSRESGASPAWPVNTAKVSVLAIAALAVALAAHTPDDEPQVVNSMVVEDTSLWQDTDDGFFVFHDNRAGTTNDPVPDAWNIYGQPLEFDAVRVYADGGVQVDIDTEDDRNATVSSALDATISYVIQLSSGDHAVTVVHEGDIADVKIVPDNADEVREFHDQLAAGSEGTAVVSDELPEPPEEVVNSMTVEDTSLWADPDDGFFVFHDSRADTTNDPVPDAWNVYGQPLEFDAVKIYADGGVQVDIDTEDDSNATLSSALDPTIRYVIRLSSGDHAVTVAHEGDIADVKIVPDNAGEVAAFHDRLTAGAHGTAVVSDEPALVPANEPDLVVESVAASDPAPAPGATFTLSATVRNTGGAAATATTLRYYRSADATISMSDTEVGTDAVGALPPSGTSPESIPLAAPQTAGTYYYGACVDPATGESDTTNNCSASVALDIRASKHPDLEVGTPSVTDTTPEPGGTFTLSATVTNAGDAASAATTLRYYRSADTAITTSDTAVGTDAVGVLPVLGTSDESILVTGPSTPGTVYYGACVDPVAGESDTTDNCSASVRVDVEAPPPPPPPPAAPSVSLNSSETQLEVKFNASFAPRETKAFAVRIRQKTQLSDSRTYCRALAYTGDEAVLVTITATAFIGSFVRPNTTYLVDYRHIGTSCTDDADNPWSLTAEFTTSTPPVDGDFDIDVVFVGQPSSSVVSAVNSAAAKWEQAITNDVTDIDYSGRPTSNACTDSEFDGVVDDLRVYVYVRPIDGVGGTAGSAGVCEFRSGSAFPVMARIILDSADVAQLESTPLYNIALHEIGHTLGFGIAWGDLLVNPSLVRGQPVTPPPDTHFAGSNAIAAFDDAGGTSYEGAKVPVENAQGGSGAQDKHWRKSVMGSELMTPTLGGSAAFSAITIQSMADLGYSVDDSVADSYTVTDLSGQARVLAAEENQTPRPRCVVLPLADARAVPETKPNTVRTSSSQWEVTELIELSPKRR